MALTTQSPDRRPGRSRLDQIFQYVIDPHGEYIPHPILAEFLTDPVQANMDLWGLISGGEPGNLTFSDNPMLRDLILSEASIFIDRFELLIEEPQIDDEAVYYGNAMVLLYLSELILVLLSTGDFNEPN